LELSEARSFELIVGQPSVQNADWTLVAPFDPNASLLYLKVSSEAPPVGQRMPPVGGALSESEVLLIRTWIEQGAREN
jgi:hypothetical protein